MNVLITGANGFLGQHLTLYLASKGFVVSATSRNASRIPSREKFTYYNVDLTDETEVKQLVATVQPDVIIHTAAMSKPDECDADKEACLLHNVAATQFLLEAVKALKPAAHFIYTSTDFIFGENGPHAENEAPAPLNFYGESKLQAENAVMNSGLFASVVRPVFIYGEIWEGLRPTFLHWVKNSLEQGKNIKVVNDQRRTPTFVQDLCNGYEQIIMQRKSGIYNLAGQDVCSPYEMAIVTARALGLNETLIEKVTSDTFKEVVVRAKQSGLKIDKARAELGYSPVAFEEGVKLTFGI
ncbi:MAG: SDR family oxidoreductase [Filimonas sp.]|nr:SDR family oxidoreductase [Filimonas sp.]